MNDTMPNDAKTCGGCKHGKFVPPGEYVSCMHKSGEKPDHQGMPGDTYIQTYEVNTPACPHHERKEDDTDD